MDKETKRFLQGMKRRQREWREWRRDQTPIVVRFLGIAMRYAKRGMFSKASRAAWNAGQAIHEMDNVWTNISAEGNQFIKTVPKGWKKWRNRCDSAREISQK